MKALRAILAFALLGYDSVDTYATAIKRGHRTTHKPRTISRSLFLDLEELSRIVDIAYCVGSPGLGVEKPFSCWGRCSQFPNFELVTTFSSGHLHGDSCGYIALSHETNLRIIVAFRGSYSLTNIIADLSTRPSPYVPYNESLGGSIPGSACKNCSVHSGFAEAWNVTSALVTQTVQDLLLRYPGYQLVLTGHSLGGAVAGLAGLEFLAKGWRPIVTTFGEPRIGNAEFAAYLNARFGLLPDSEEQDDDDDLTHGPRYRRVTHAGDPVPLLPFEKWGYVSHAGEIHISKASLYPEIEDVWQCSGDADPACIDSEVSTKNMLESYISEAKEQNVLSAVHDVGIGLGGPVLPSRAHVWELVARHRDYFWRLGLCVPGSDPWNWFGHPYPRDETDGPRSGRD